MYALYGYLFRIPTKHHYIECNQSSAFCDTEEGIYDKYVCMYVARKTTEKEETKTKRSVIIFKRMPDTLPVLRTCFLPELEPVPQPIRNSI